MTACDNQAAVSFLRKVTRPVRAPGLTARLASEDPLGQSPPLFLVWREGWGGCSHTHSSTESLGCEEQLPCEVTRAWPSLDASWTVQNNDFDVTSTFSQEPRSQGHVVNKKRARAGLAGPMARLAWTPNPTRVQGPGACGASTKPAPGDAV